MRFISVHCSLTWHIFLISRYSRFAFSVSIVFLSLMLVYFSRSRSRVKVMKNSIYMSPKHDALIIVSSIELEYEAQRDVPYVILFNFPSA